MTQVLKIIYNRKNPEPYVYHTIEGDEIKRKRSDAPVDLNSTLGLKCDRIKRVKAVKFKVIGQESEDEKKRECTIEDWMYLLSTIPYFIGNF